MAAYMIPCRARFWKNVFTIIERKVRDMNKHVSMKKKVLSFFLAFVILFSSMPAELFTFAFANDGTETTTQPAVSVKLSATPGGSRRWR